MNTFLPYPSSKESAKVLDNERLGKQRVEAYQILKTLQKGPKQCSFNKNHWVTYNINPSNPKQKFWLCTVCEYSPKNTPWYNHPAVQMWKGHERALAFYTLQCCATWIGRGFKDTIMNKIETLWKNLPENSSTYPKWFRDERFHASHRSNLLRKDPKHYGQFGWKDRPYQCKKNIKHNVGIVTTCGRNNADWCQECDSGIKPTPYFWPTKEGY